MMLSSILYKVVIILCFLLPWRVSHPSYCKSFVTDPGSLELLFLQNRAACLWILSSVFILF